MIRSKLRSLLERCGYSISRHSEYDRMISKVQRPLNLVELAVRSIVAETEAFFFIQVGANDGVRADPLNGLIKRFRLPGLLVEPLPDFYEHLVSNYASEGQLKFENAAISRTDGAATIFRFAPDAPIVDWLHGTASIDRKKIYDIAKRRDLVNLIQEVHVPSVTIKSLLSKHDIEPDDVTLLQIDTEGYDWEVLQMCFEASMLPRVVNFEHINLSNSDRYEAHRLLSKKGYSTIDTRHDTLGILYD